MSTSRILVSSGTEFESTVGYSRACASARSSSCPGRPHPPPRRHRRSDTRRVRRIEVALVEAGAALSDVVRTRIYVTDISRWREVAAVHAEVFDQIRPAATMVEVAALI